MTVSEKPTLPVQPRPPEHGRCLSAVAGRDEVEVLRQRLEDLDELYRQACDDLVSVQNLLVHLAGLNATLRRLHEATNRAEVLATIRETVVDVVGSEQIALLLVGPDGALAPAALPGIPPVAAPLPLDRLREALAEDRILLGPEASAACPGLVALVPLRAHRAPAGALLLLGLLPQKAGLGAKDLEVLELLHVHAALALRAAEAPVRGWS